MSGKLALINGRIYTLDSTGVAEAIIASASDGKILRVGDASSIRQLCGADTEIIDLKGKTVLPGLNDSHMHMLLYGLSLDNVQLSGVKSRAEIIYRGKKHIEENRTKPGEWISGWGWDQELFENKAFPTIQDIDSISTQHPIIYTRNCGHMAVVNSMAIQISGLDEYWDEEGTNIDRDESGHYTGIIKETAINYVKSKIPKPDVLKIKNQLEKAFKEAAKVGLTSIQTSDLNYCRNFDDLNNAYNSLKDENKLTVRVYEQLNMPSMKILKDFLDMGLRSRDGDDYFKLGPLKLITDGSLGARTASLREGYSDSTDKKGVLTYSQKELDELVATAHTNKMQILLHAIGDGAMESCLSALEKVMGKGTNTLRHRINHCQIGSNDIFEKMAELGILADIQPIFVSSDWHMAESRVGKERANQSYAWKTMLDKGIRLAGGSDCPIESFNPFKGIYSAVTRKDMNGNPLEGWHPEQKLSLQEALGLFTTGAAYASFDEDKKGTLTEGKLADMIVIGEDIFKVNQEAIKNIEVLATIVGGKIIYMNF